MIKYSKLEQALRSRDFILCVAIFSVIWLTPNTYYVYYSMMENYAPIWRELASGGVALLVASGILIYTLHGDIKIANYYMWFEISVSSFYYIVTIGWEWWLIPAFSFVFMLPVSLKHYTTKLNKDKEADPDTDTHTQIDNVIIEEYRRKTQELQQSFIEADNANDSLRADNEMLRLKLEQYKTMLDAAHGALGPSPKITELKEKSLEEMTEEELLKIAKSSPDLPDHLFT
jgi:FtsZ-binding cell division protein ZapB